MNKFLKFKVFGTPVTQGSASAYVRGGRAHIVTKTPPLIEWRELVRLAAVKAMEDYGLERQDGPARVYLNFYLPRPKSAPKTRDILPEKGRTDLDKYVRAVLDAMTNAGVFTDDTRVTFLAAEKAYAVGRELKHIYNPVIHREIPGLEAKVLWRDSDVR